MFQKNQQDYSLQTSPDWRRLSLTQSDNYSIKDDSIETKTLMGYCFFFFFLESANRKCMWGSLVLVYQKQNTPDIYSLPSWIPANYRQTGNDKFNLKCKSVFVIPYNNTFVCSWFAHISEWLLIYISSVFIRLDGTCKIPLTYMHTQTRTMLKALRVQCYLVQLIKQPVSVHTWLMKMNSTVSVWINANYSMCLCPKALSDLAQ